MITTDNHHPHTIIIAEAGVNHNGSLDMAREMVAAAAAAGADYVKFQTAVPELVISTIAPKAEYQKATTGTAESQLEMCRKIHLAAWRLRRAGRAMPPRGDRLHVDSL